MTSIRRIGSAFVFTAALSLPILASAEQAATPACEGEKAEHKQPTAERSKQEADKSEQKQDPKSDRKTNDKVDPAQSGKSS
jgi:hypothetical protein